MLISLKRASNKDKMSIGLICKKKCIFYCILDTRYFYWIFCCSFWLFTNSFKKSHFPVLCICVIVLLLRDFLIDFNFFIMLFFLKTMWIFVAVLMLEEWPFVDTLSNGYKQAVQCHIFGYVLWHECFHWHLSLRCSCEGYQEATTGGGANPGQSTPGSQDGCGVYLRTAWRGNFWLESSEGHHHEGKLHLHHRQL